MECMLVASPQVTRLIITSPYVEAPYYLFIYLLNRYTVKYIFNNI
jgi:hypothetical protein